MGHVIEGDEFDAASEYDGDIDHFVRVLNDYHPKALSLEKLITDYSRLGKPNPNTTVGQTKRSRNIAMLEVLSHLGYIERKNVDGMLYYRAASDSSSSKE